MSHFFNYQSLIKFISQLIILYILSKLPNQYIIITF